MRKAEFSLKDIEACLQRKSWWAMIFILPIARRISLFFINRTNASPNSITLSAFLFILGAMVSYGNGSYPGLVIGAILFEFNYLFDCVDGTVARVKGLTSPLGAFLDPMLDRLRILILSLSLAFGQFTTSGNIKVVFLVLLYLGLNNLLLLSRNAQGKAIEQIGIRSGVEITRTTTKNNFLAWWFNFTSKRHIMAYYHDIELDALVFVIGPIFNLVVPFLIAANVLAFILILILNILFLVALRRTQGVW